MELPTEFCSVEGFFVISDPTSRLQISWQALLGIFKACLSSLEDRSESEKQKSQTLSRAELTGIAMHTLQWRKGG